MHREPEVPEGRGPSGKMARLPCKDYFRGTCINSFCEKWHHPECLFCKTKSGCRFGEKCSYAHRQVDEQPTKRSKKNDDKSAVAMLKKGDWQERGPVTDQCHDRPGQHDKKSDKKLKHGPVGRRSSNTRQLGCVFQDMTPPKSILRKSTDMQRPIQRVKFTKAIARHTKIHPPASSSAPYPQELDQWSASIEEPLHTSTAEKSERPEQNRDHEMPVWTVSQRFSHLQWRRLFKELWGRPTTTADFGSSFRQLP